MTDVLYNKINAYFSKMKSVNVHMLGIDLDEILILRANEKNSNQRITYNTCNIMNTEDNQTFSCYLNHLNLNKKIFDIAFCLSITMWIHLNHGDEGLRTFLSKVASLTKYLVIEPQPWKSYKTARRRLRKLKQDDFHNFEDLKIRDNILEYIDDYLITECNMIRLARLGETCWDRPITLYENVSQV